MKMRRNTRWEEMEKGQIELSRLIQHFEAFNKSEAKSARTVGWYNQVLGLFLSITTIYDPPLTTDIDPPG